MVFNECNIVLAFVLLGGGLANSFELSVLFIVEGVRGRCGHRSVSEVTVRINACHIHQQDARVNTIMMLRSVILNHTVVLLILVSSNILTDIHVITPIIQLVLKVVNVIDTFVRILFLSTLLSLVYFGTLLLSMIVSARSDPLPLKHAAVAACGANFLEDVIFILVVDDIDDVPALIDIQGVVSSVLLILDSSRPLVEVAFT